MARPQSEEKRSHILQAATQVVAERGDSAPTAQIAKLAGVAEGSIFTYFQSKEELLNALYDTLAADVHEAARTGFPKSGEGRAKLQHVWKTCVAWALANPTKYVAGRVLRFSHYIAESRRARDTAIGSQFLAADLDLSDDPPGFSCGALMALMDLTVELSQKNPRLAERYSRAGFQAMLRIIGKS